MFCSSCGSPLPSCSQFCTQCGARVAPAPDALCPACGKPVPAGMRFCIFCGAPMTAPSAAAPAPTVAGSSAGTQAAGLPEPKKPAAGSSEPEPAMADSSVSKASVAAAPESAANAPTFQFLCPHCGQGLEVETALAGQTGACPLCGKPIVVPSPPAVSV